MHKTFFTISLAPLKRISITSTIISGTVIWTVILPIILLHAWVYVYQEIYFSINGIPKAKFRDYVSYDRHRLAKLSWAQKLSCAYCAYANGFVAWIKTVINRTEAYSCAIKHQSMPLGHEHQRGFAPFEDYS